VGHLRESETAAVTSTALDPKGVGACEALGAGVTLFSRPCTPPRPGAIICPNAVERTSFGMSSMYFCTSHLQSGQSQPQ